MRYQLLCKRALVPNLFLEDAAGSSYNQLPVLAADEVSAAPVQAGASTELPVLAADEVSTPVQAGVGTKFILEDASALSRLNGR
jgi:hypothetical protein